MSLLLLSESDVRHVLGVADLFESMEQALAAFSAGTAVQPLRTVVPVSTGPGLFGLMPAHLPDRGALGAKLVTVFSGNAGRGLPTHLAVIALFDEHTGQLRALVDGRYITEIRTAAVSAVAARLLARPEASRLAVLGTGVQARSHLRAFAAIRPLASAAIWSPRPAHVERFIEEMGGEVSFPLHAAANARDCVRDADLVVFATAATTPIVSNADVQDGAHVTAVGSCRPDQRELDSAFVARARVFVDSRQAALAEAGDILLAIRDGLVSEEGIAGEIGDVIAGRVQGRQSTGQVTLFKSLGLACEDVVSADLACARAVEQSVGRTLDL